jgi:hypothetical protein
LLSSELAGANYRFFVDGIKMFKKILLASALLVSSTVASHAIVLFSDNFDSNAHVLNTTPAGWTLDYGSLDVIGSPDFPWYGLGAYIDMNGSTSQSGGMHTNSTFNFLAGNIYTVSFDYGNNKNSAGKSLEGLTAGAGLYNASVTSTAQIASLLAFSFSFTPTVNFVSALYFNGFESDAGDNGGLILDNVSLSVVPVPAALPLLAGGLGILGFASRRRKAKAVA